MKKFNLIRHVTVSLIFGMLLALAICTISIAAVPNVKIPKVEYRGGIYYLVLDAKTPFERGYQHGKALEFPIKFALRNFIEWLRNEAGIKNAERMIQDLQKLRVTSIQSKKMSLIYLKK